MAKASRVVTRAIQNAAQKAATASGNAHNDTLINALRNEATIANRDYESGREAYTRSLHRFAYIALVYWTTGKHEANGKLVCTDKVARIYKSPLIAKAADIGNTDPKKRGPAIIRSELTYALLGVYEPKKDEQVIRNDDGSMRKRTPEEWTRDYNAYKAKQSRIVEGVDFAMAIHAMGGDASMFDKKTSLFSLPLYMIVPHGRRKDINAQLNRDVEGVVISKEKNRSLIVMMDTIDPVSKKPSRVAEAFTLHLTEFLAIAVAQANVMKRNPGSRGKRTDTSTSAATVTGAASVTSGTATAESVAQVMAFPEVSAEIDRRARLAAYNPTLGAAVDHVLTNIIKAHVVVVGEGKTEHKPIKHSEVGDAVWDKLRELREWLATMDDDKPAAKPAVATAIPVRKRGSRKPADERVTRRKAA